MRYLYEQGRFRLYETDRQDEVLSGTTGELYAQDTVLLFESVESEVEIGREIAWAPSEQEAVDLAADITAGVRNIPIDVQVSLAEKVMEDRARLAREAERKAARQGSEDLPSSPKIHNS